MIVITGATGMIGLNLIDKLEDFQVTCFVRKTSDIKKLLSNNISIYTGKLSNILDIIDAIQHVDTLIHLAAITNSNNKEELYKLNTEYVRNIVKACVKTNTRLIYVSSANTLLKNKDDYSKSKLAAENIIKKSGVRYIIIRPTLVYDKKGGKDFAKLSRLIDLIPLIPIANSGKNLFQPLFVDDLTDLIKQLILEKKYKLSVDIGGGEVLSFKEMIWLLGKINNKKPLFINIPIPPIKKFKYFLQDRIVDNKTAVGILKKHPLTFKEGIRRIKI